MSCFDVKILDSNINTIQIETRIGEQPSSQIETCIGDPSSSQIDIHIYDQPSSVDITTHDNISTVEINQNVALLPSEFNNLITVKDILSGSGILVQSSSGIYTVSATGTINNHEEILEYISSSLFPSIGDLNILYIATDVSRLYKWTGNEYVEIGPSSLIYANNELLPSVTGSGYVISSFNFNNNVYTISVSGLQPSGNYANAIHTHTSSQITDFNSSVSGLLPVKNISSGSGISVTNNNGNFTVSVTGQFEFTSEQVDDRVNDLLVAGSNIVLNYNDLNNQLTISTSGLQSSGNYSVVGHQHNVVDITNFSSGVSGLLPSISGSGYVNVSSSSGNYTISVSGLQPSGNYANSIHTHTASDITDFNSSVSGLLPITNISSGSYVNISQSGTNFTVSATGLQPSGNYSLVEHTHTSSDITNFNSSVSGLLPVKDIVGGSGIVVSSSSGIYTINANVSGVILEAIQDNLGSGFFVAGTGVQLTYNDIANTLTLDNLHTEINELSLEPQGFVNRLDSTISFNDSTRTFTIAPTGASYDVYIEGVKVTKTTSESIVIPTGTALNYLHFNTDTGLLDNKTTFFNFDTDVPIAFIHWNSDINQSTFFGEERHGIRMDSMTHKWIHNTFGMQYINGLSIGGYTLLGNGSSNSHAQIDISDGVLYQEDINIHITNGTGSGSFIQPLSPIAYIPVYYHLGTTGQWVRDISTPYPLKYNATRALYNLYSDGTWTTPNVPNNRYFAMWIVATNDMNDPILAIMGQREDSSLNSAENYNIWSDINLTNIPTNEIRPLYRLIFVTNDTFTNTPKSSLQSILDLRKSIITSTYGISQNDHGNLFGLGDDDHYQYVHINEARTISANHTLTNGLTISSGLLSATSGNFTNLTINNIPVSVSGHTHGANDIDSGTLSDSILSAKVQSAINIYLWSSFR